MLSSNSSIPLLLGAIHRGGTSHSNRTSIDIRYDPPGVSDAEKRVHSYLYTLGAGNVTADSHEAQLRVHVQTLIRLLDHAKHATAPTDQACNDVARAQTLSKAQLIADGLGREGELQKIYASLSRSDELAGCIPRGQQRAQGSVTGTTIAGGSSSSGSATTGAVRSTDGAIPGSSRTQRGKSTVSRLYSQLKPRSRRSTRDT